jgi:hypothetical protein
MDEDDSPTLTDELETDSREGNSSELLDKLSTCSGVISDSMGSIALLGSVHATNAITAKRHKNFSQILPQNPGTNT